MVDHKNYEVVADDIIELFEDKKRAEETVYLIFLCSGDCYAHCDVLDNALDSYIYRVVFHKGRQRFYTDQIDCPECPFWEGCDPSKIDQPPAYCDDIWIQHMHEEDKKW